MIGFRWQQFVQLIKEYFKEKGSAYNLALFRIGFFFILGAHFIVYSTTTGAAWTMLPDSSRVGMPFMDWIIYNIPISPAIYKTSAIVGGVLCWMVCLGIFTRYTLLLLIPFALYTTGVPMFYGKISHYHILLWVPVMLCFSPVADVMSIDAVITRKNKTVIENHVKYMLPFKILWIQLAIIYFFAGLVKLWDCGLDWALSDSMINQMRWEWVEHYDKVPWLRLDNYPVVAKLGGQCVIYFELLYFLLILKPKARIWAFIGAFSMHKLAGYFMYIDFSNLRMIAASYINWHSLFLFLKNKGRRVFTLQKETNDEASRSSYPSARLRLTLVIGLTVVSINFIFSAFRIHSFPFSSYPTYSAIVPGEIRIIRMDALTAGGEKTDVKQLGREAGFRWENIRPYESRIAQAFDQRDTLLVKTRLKQYWSLWKNNVKRLENVRQVKMYLQKFSIVPEQRHVVLASDYLGTVTE